MRILFLRRAFALSFTVGIITSLAFAGDVTRTKTVQNFFKSNTKLRVSEDAAEVYLAALNQMSLKVIQQAAALAQEEGRSTILDRDVSQATEEVFRRAPIAVPELMEKIKQLSIIDLSDLTNQVKAYGDDLLKQKE